MADSIEKYLETIKEPALSITYIQKNIQPPNLKSHLGGYPYIKKADKTPRCKCCSEELEFVFQMFKPGEKDNQLFVFYYCFGCMVDFDSDGFHVMIYQNPSLEEAEQDDLIDGFPYYDFHFQPKWSLPQWETILDLHPTLSELLIQNHQDDALDMYTLYSEAILSNELGLDNFSFYKGYSHFLIDHESVFCDQCKKNMNQLIQLASIPNAGLSWGGMDGNLHLFQCSEHKDEFKIIIQ